MNLSASQLARIAEELDSWLAGGGVRQHERDAVLQILRHGSRERWRHVSFAGYDGDGHGSRRAGTVYVDLGHARTRAGGVTLVEWIEARLDSRDGGNE